MSEPITPALNRRPLLVNGEALRLNVTAPRSGGGEKYDPQTAEEARELLLPQIREAVSEASELPGEWRASDRLYLEAKLLPNYLAASQFPAALLAQIGATSVGSRADSDTYRTRQTERPAPTRRLVFTIGDSNLASLERLVATGGRTRTEQQAFQEIRKLNEFTLPATDKKLRLPANEGDFASDATRIWEAVLHPAITRSGEPVPLDAETLNRWIELVAAEGGEVQQNYVRTVAGLTFTPIALTHDHLDAVARFNPLRVLRPMPAIRPRPRFGLRSQQKLMPPVDTRPLSDVASVAVFDGGVHTSQRSALLFPIAMTDLTPEPGDSDSMDHGTGVTAAALFGLVAPGGQAPRPALPVTSYRVLPAPDDPYDLEGYWVLDQIRAAVEQDGHKIVNLSLGPTLAVEDDLEPNRWTSELDQLAWDNDVLFVVAAGNDGDQDQAAGLHRVQVPADMANGLTVGACDAPAPEKPWQRAPYSSMGPGRYGSRVQPSGVQFGGVDGRLFELVRADGSFLEASGTSFAAPVTTHALSDLAAQLPRVNSSVLRAFSVHFAERHAQYRKLLDEVGFGRQPLSFDDALECGPNEAHVLFVDEIVRGDLLGYALPLPHVVRGKIKVRMTLAYASPVDPTQPTEYTNASLEVLLRPHQSLFSLRPPAGVDAKPQVLNLSGDPARDLLTEGWNPSQEPVTKPLGANAGSDEGRLRDGGKWETIRNYSVTLSPEEIDSPRIELGYIARRAGLLDNSPPSVPFALLITASDTSGSGAFYDDVRNDHGRLRPIQRVQSQVRVRGGSRPVWH